MVSGQMKSRQIVEQMWWGRLAGMKKGMAETIPLSLHNSNTTELQSGHWVLSVRFRHFPNQEFNVGQILSDERHALSVAHSLPLRLELLVAPDLRRVGQ